MEKFFVSRPIFAIVLAIVIVLIGGIATTTLPVEQYPDITPPVVQVTATYDGADAQTVNSSVATPVCQSIMGVSDLMYMQATSSNAGELNVDVIFDVGSDPDLDAIFTQNNVATATALLPTSVTQQGVTTQKAMLGFLSVYSLYSDGRYDNDFLSNYAYINVQNDLLKINGVGRVNILGSGQYAMRVWIRPDVLDYYNITVDEIVAAIESQSGVFPAGTLGGQPISDSIQFTYTVTMPPELESAEQYDNIVVKTTAGGAQIRLKDVAEVTLGSKTYGVESIYGDNPGVMIVVYQTPGSNAVSVNKAVSAEMEKLSKSFVDGVEYIQIVNSTASIKDGITDIFRTLIIALILVIIIIYLFLEDWKATLIPLIAIPVSLVGAFMFFPLLGFSINIISMLALVLAIGLVVDDAIVVVEAVQVNIEKGMPSKAATLDAMRSVAPPIVATTVVLCAVFIPIALVGGIVGKLYQQFSITIAAAVVISAFNALTLSPALCSILLKKKERHTKGFFFRFNKWFGGRVEGYLRFSNVVIRHSVRTFVFVLIIGGAMIGLFKALPTGFLPDEDQGYLMVMVNLPNAASVSRTTATIKEMTGIIERNPNVEHVTSAAGYNMMAGIQSTSNGIIFVKLKPFNERKQTAAEIADELDAVLYSEVVSGDAYAMQPPSIPGLGMTSGVTFMTQDRDGQGIGWLVEQTERLLDTLNKMPQISSATTQFNAQVPQRRIIINEQYALREGVEMSQIHALLSTYLGGRYINNFNRFGKLYQTYVQAAPEYRTDSRDLNSYYVTNGNGQSVPLSAFVTIKDTVGVEYMTQFDLYTSVDVTVLPAKGYSTTQVMDLVQNYIDDKMPTGMGLAWTGVSFQQKNSSNDTGIYYLLALIFVFLSLAALYDSWAMPLSILLGVPFALFGALLFVELAHLVKPVFVDNVFMQISLLMLIGLAAKNAILIIEYANRLFFEEGQSLVDASIGAAKLRVRPIIMTAFAFILGVMPLIFASGAYSTARNVMGVALVGGMLIATVIGIFVYPALYYMIAKVARFERKRERKAAEK